MVTDIFHGLRFISMSIMSEHHSEMGGRRYLLCQRPVFQGVNIPDDSNGVSDPCWQASRGKGKLGSDAKLLKIVYVYIYIYIYQGIFLYLLKLKKTILSISRKSTIIRVVDLYVGELPVIPPMPLFKLLKGNHHKLVNIKTLCPWLRARFLEGLDSRLHP